MNKPLSGFVLSPPRLSCLSLLTLSALQPMAHAAEHSITSGGLLRQAPELSRALRPAKDATPQDTSAADAAQETGEDEVHFPVQDYLLDGDLTPEERERVEAYLAPLRGRQMTLRALQIMRAELTELLYHDGESLVRVVLPEQTVDQGVVHFQVVRGHIEGIRIVNGSEVSTDRIERIMQGRGIAAPKLRDIDSRMRLVRQLPGVGGAEATLSAGQFDGGTIATITVAPAPTLYGSINADNAGSPEVGERRIALMGGINNPFGRGDRFEAMVLTTPAALQTHESDGAQTRMARVSYDTPVGNGATRAGAAVSHVAYRLGGTFDGLGKGSADVASLYATRPVWRTRTSSLDVGVELDHKELKDDRFYGLLQSERSTNVASVRADGSGVAGEGRWRKYFGYGVGVSYGGVAMSDLDRTTGEPAVRKHDTFVKVEPTASLVVAPVSSLQLGARFRAQWANGALDGSERMNLGGPGAVRAYALNAPATDNGAIVSLEASHDFFSPNARLSVFYDGAVGRYRGALGQAGHSVDLQGAGVGVNWNWKGVQGQVSLARPIGRSNDAPKDDQLWVTLGKSF